MELMYCFPGLEMFIDSTIKKCLLEYDLETEDTESVLNDIAKAMVRPMDSECFEKLCKDGNVNTLKSRQVVLNASKIKDLSSVLGAVNDLQMLNSIDGMNTGKGGEAIASLEKGKHKMLSPSHSALDLSKRPGSEKSAQSSPADQENSSRYQPEESKSSGLDIMDSSNLATKLKSRLQQRYFQNSTKVFPESMRSEKEQKPTSPCIPHSGYSDSIGKMSDHSSPPSPTVLNRRKRRASGDSVDEKLSPCSGVEKDPAQEQSRIKVLRLIEYSPPHNSSSRPRSTRHPQKQTDKDLFPHSNAENTGSIAHKPLAQEERSTKAPNLIEYSTSPNPVACHRRMHQSQKEADENLIPLSNAENTGSRAQKYLASEQPEAKITHSLECSTPPSSTCSHRPVHHSQKEKDDSLLTLYSLAFRSSPDGSVPIETLNRSMHIPILLKDQMVTSPSLTKQSQTEFGENHPTAKHVRPLSLLTCSGSQPTQNHIVNSPQKINHDQPFPFSTQRLHQRNQRSKPQGLNPTLLPSHHHNHRQEMPKRQQSTDEFHQDPKAAEIFLGHTSLISSIIAEELLKAGDNDAPKSTQSCVGNKIHSSIAKFPSRVTTAKTSASKIDMHTTENWTMQYAVPTVTSAPSSRASPLIAVSRGSLPSSPFQNPLETSQRQPVPLSAHQKKLKASRVCVVPESSICLNVCRPEPVDQYDDNVPQDLSHKSSRRKAEGN